jgi:Matrixin
LVAAALFGAAGAASAYSKIGSKWAQPGGLGSPIMLTYSYQNMFDGTLKMPNGQPLPKLLIRESIEEALGLWASVVPIHFVEVKDDGKLYSQGATQFGKIRFRHTFINGPDPLPPALPVAKAQAYYPSSSGVNPGDVEYDRGDPWQEIGTQPVPDILGATIHELGHSLGLGHSNDEEAAMYWIFNRFSGIGTGQLYADDITGIRSIYGTGVGNVTPLAGTWQDRPVAPTGANSSQFTFNGVSSGSWFDPSSYRELHFSAAAGTTFSQIAEFPAGFENAFTLTVDGSVIGQFTGGQSFSFTAFPGGGVSEFVISGINEPINTSNGFPIKLAFTSPTGSFTTIGVPEPATQMLLLVAILTSLSLWERAGERVPWKRLVTASKRVPHA